MSAREQLLMTMLKCADQQPCGWDDVADAILAAGWRPPARVVSTVDEFRAIPARAVVQTRHVAFEMYDGHRVDAELWMHPDNGPVRVLHEGGAA